jgi:hypothetical protein
MLIKSLSHKQVRLEAKGVAAMVKWAFVICIMLLNAIGSSYARDGLILGDWRMTSGLITADKPISYQINAETAWNYGEVGRSSCTRIKKPEEGHPYCYKLSLNIGCEGNRYKLQFVTVCQNCDQSRTVSVGVSVDGNRQFNLQGIDTEGSGQSSGQGSVIEAPLAAEQVLALSQMRRSILVTPVGRAPIYVEPNGTTIAFATLDAACKSPPARPKE